MFISANTEPTTRPDGSPLQDGDQWNDKEWITIITDNSPIAEEEEFIIDANTYVLDANDAVANTTIVANTSFTESEGMWVTANSEITITIDGTDYQPEPLPTRPLSEE
jgi:hypothetical protein